MAEVWPSQLQMGDPHLAFGESFQVRRRGGVCVDPEESSVFAGPCCRVRNQAPSLEASFRFPSCPSYLPARTLQEASPCRAACLAALETSALVAVAAAAA